MTNESATSNEATASNGPTVSSGMKALNERRRKQGLGPARCDLRPCWEPATKLAIAYLVCRGETRHLRLNACEPCAEFIECSFRSS